MHSKWYRKYFLSSAPSYFQLISSRTVSGDPASAFCEAAFILRAIEREVKKTFFAFTV